MERLKRLFGYDDQSKRVVVPASVPQSDDKSTIVSTGNSTTEVTTKPTLQATSEVPTSSFHKFSDKTEQYLRQHINVVEGDCLSCKIIGMTLPFVGAMYIFTLGAIRRRTTDLHPARFFLRYTSLGTLMLVLSYQRATDTGLYTPRVTEEEKNQGFIDRTMCLLRKDLETTRSKFITDKTNENPDKDK